MRNQLPRGYAGLLLVACSVSLSSGQSLAAEPAKAAPSSDPFAAFKVVPAQDLAATRGRAGDLTIVSSNQKFNSAVKDSTFNADNINTGAVTVGEKAFAGFGGIGVNVLNSGNSNSITTGVNLTINLH